MTGTPALFPVPAGPPRRRGRTERAVDAAVRDLAASGALDVHGQHAPVAALLRVLGHQLDVADAAEQSYVSATVARAMMEVLDRIGAWPDAGGASAPDLLAWLADDENVVPDAVARTPDG